MKRAGRKNQGAWYRANKAITGVMSLGEKEALITLLEVDIDIGTLFDALISQASTVGVTIPGAPESVGDWVAQFFVHGIPLQIWMGKPTFTTYTRSGIPGEYLYEPDKIAEYQDGGERIRKIVSDFLFARRQFRDVFNVGLAKEGNPGGYPDAKVDEPEEVEG